jgi:hypothetical protein
MKNIIENGSILITSYWPELDFSNVAQCRFAGTKISREIQNCVKNGSIFINTYWLELGYSHVAQCWFAGTKTIKK